MNRDIVAPLLTILILLSGCIGEEQTNVFYGEDINPHIPVDDFILLDEKGENISISDYEGMVLVVAFLFTRCPDICPVVSSNLAFIVDQMGDRHGKEMQVLTITVDPWTDNSTVLKDYADDRDLDWPHISGELPDLERVWLNFDVGLQSYNNDTDEDGVADGFDTCPNTPKGEEVDGNGCGLETEQNDGEITIKHHPLAYWVDHTTGTIIVDKNMNQRVWWGDLDWNPELVLEDIEYLIDE